MAPVDLAVTQEACEAYAQHTLVSQDGALGCRAAPATKADQRHSGVGRLGRGRPWPLLTRLPARSTRYLLNILDRLGQDGVGLPEFVRDGDQHYDLAWASHHQHLGQHCRART